jgi:hypothetical protein
MYTKVSTLQPLDVKREVVSVLAMRAYGIVALTNILHSLSKLNDM